VDFERPDLDLFEAELDPPEMHDREQQPRSTG
jgi:hypothetical protein